MMTGPLSSPTNTLGSTGHEQKLLCIDINIDIGIDTSINIPLKIVSTPAVSKKLTSKALISIPAPS
jgi:hypothetical protein